jgi:hypothetical protein
VNRVQEWAMECRKEEEGRFRRKAWKVGFKIRPATISDEVINGQ